MSHLHDGGQRPGCLAAQGCVSGEHTHGCRGSGRERWAGGQLGVGILLPIPAEGGQEDRGRIPGLGWEGLTEEMSIEC